MNLPTRTWARRSSACILLGLLALPGCGSDDTTAPPGGSVGEADRHLVLLFTSDEHSHLFAFSPELDDYPAATEAGTGALVGGVARRAAVLGRERAAAESAGKDTLTVSAGDNQMGCLPHVAFQSHSVDYGTMASLGYDVTTLGNHELDFGPSALAASISAAEAGEGMPPIVASNVHFSDASPDDDALAAHYSEDVTDSAAIHPYRVVTTKGGLKVGVFGYVGVNAAHVAPNKTPVQFSALDVPVEDEGALDVVLPKLYADLQPIVDKLRNEEKVDLVIGLAHAGVADSKTEEGRKAGEDYNVALNVAGIDVIISGHEHNPDPAPIVVQNATTGKDCLVLNGSAFGRHVGRVDLAVPAAAGGAITFDAATQQLLTVDDTTIPDMDEASRLDGLLETIEDSGVGATPYLEGLLSRVEGEAVANDPAKAGDLYFHPIGKTDFDVKGTDSLLYLSADSMLAAADAAGDPADVSLESAGVIRSGLAKGKTGVISAADAFNVVPLGFSRTDGSIGYPIAKAYVSLIELRGVVEFALNLGATSSDYHIRPAGMKVEYDATRPPVLHSTDLLLPQKGQVMRISLDSDHSDGLDQFDKVIYDREAGIGGAADLFSVVTSSYIAQFAADVGVVLKDKDGVAQTLDQSVLHRGDGTEIKQVESFLSYLAVSPGGTLASTYDATSASAANRFVCIAGCP